MIPARTAIWLFIPAALGGLAVWSVMAYVFPPKPVVIEKRGKTITVPVPKKVETVREVPRFVPVNAQIAFFPKEEIAKAMKVPVDELPDNITKAGEVPPHDGKTLVFSSLNLGADNVYRADLSYRQVPRPWFGFNPKYFEAEATMIVAGQTGLRGGITYRPIRIWNENILARGSVELRSDGTTEGRIEVGILHQFGRQP